LPEFSFTKAFDSETLYELSALILRSLRGLRIFQQETSHEIGWNCATALMSTPSSFLLS